MNGRVYDPELGRFLSADPHVQAPYNSQSYNRYSYVLNNPLKYTDPSGYFLKKLFKGIKKLFKNKIFRMIAAIAFAAIAGPALFWHLAATTSLSIGAATIVSGAIVGFGAGLIASGGDLRAGLLGGVTGGLAGWIGSSSVFGTVGKITVQRVVAHGVVGGINSRLSGGKFIHGFVSSGFTKSISGQIKGLTNANPIAGATAAAVVGGTVSEMTGGKFANGAATSAMAYLFNECAVGDCGSGPKKGDVLSNGLVVMNDKTYPDDVLIKQPSEGKAFYVPAGVSADASTATALGSNLDAMRTSDAEAQAMTAKALQVVGAGCALASAGTCAVVTSSVGLALDPGVESAADYAIGMGGKGATGAAADFIDGYGKMKAAETLINESTGRDVIPLN